jgi:hypothetical protein
VLAEGTRLAAVCEANQWYRVPRDNGTAGARRTARRPGPGMIDIGAVAIHVK